VASIACIPSDGFRCESGVMDVKTVRAGVRVMSHPKDAMAVLSSLPGQRSRSPVGALSKSRKSR
jgi:hypothetical protein